LNYGHFEQGTVRRVGYPVPAVPAAAAILDRFLHHAEVVTITGKSYRLKNPTPNKEKPAKDPCPQEDR